MSVKTIQVEVSEHTYSVAQAVKTTVKNIKTALDDGFQPGTDLPVIITGSFPALVEAIQNLSSVSGESSENMEAFIKAWMLSGAELAGMFFTKPAAPAA